MGSFSMDNWENIREKVLDAAATRKTYHSQIKEGKEKLEEFQNLLGHLEECRRILQLAAQQTQNLLKEDLENIVSAALASVPFKHDYEFMVMFVPRRNTTECDLLFKRNGKLMEPLESCGYGAADIASFSLRVAYWKLHGGLRPFIACDEPFHNLDKTKHIYAMDIVKRLNQELGIQFLISSHEPTIIEAGDRVLECTMTDGVSTIKERK